VTSFRSENLYQLFSYLKNHNVRIPSGTQLDGMLLYPQVGSQFDAQFAIQGSTVRLATVDLGRPWRDISERLRGLVASPHL
jgi:5-methylcytosine-specific restriction enzyme subunit McrC